MTTVFSIPSASMALPLKISAIPPRAIRFTSRYFPSRAGVKGVMILSDRIPLSS